MGEGSLNNDTRFLCFVTVVLSSLSWKLSIPILNTWVPVDNNLRFILIYKLYNTTRTWLLSLWHLWLTATYFPQKAEGASLFNHDDKFYGTPDQRIRISRVPDKWMLCFVMKIPTVQETPFDIKFVLVLFYTHYNNVF